MMGLLDFLFGDRSLNEQERKERNLSQVKKRISEGNEKLAKARVGGDQLKIDKAEREIAYWENLLERLLQNKR